MRLQLEHIHPDAGRSFRLLLDSRLNDFYYWHHHPEWELSYIRDADGTRHVGEHVSKFEGDSLVLIGSHIPHLNVDYGVKTDYRKTILHIHPDLIQRMADGIPEMEDFQKLITRSAHGINIWGHTKVRIGAMMEGLSGLSSFDQFLEVLRIFQCLAESTETELLHATPVSNQHTRKTMERMEMLYRFIEAHYGDPIELEEVAVLCHMTKAAFCRYFKQQTRLTFTEFLNHYRVNQAKRLLLTDESIGNVCYACGFESLSYFNRVFRKLTGSSPGGYRKRFLPG